jgi:hypothetical protein
MKHRLAHRYVAAAFGEDIILLDQTDYSYQLLATSAGRIVPAQSHTALDIDDQQLAADLIAAGVLNPATPSRSERRLESPVATLAMPTVALSAADILDLGRVWLAAQRDGRTGTFARLVASARRRTITFDALATAEPSAGVADCVARFQLALPWLPFQGACLLRSYMLLLFLRRKGHDAIWAFGVRTWPFLAHCWLQIGDTALDETADSLRGLRPILAV